MRFLRPAARGDKSRGLHLGAGLGAVLQAVLATPQLRLRPRGGVQERNALMRETFDTWTGAPADVAHPLKRHEAAFARAANLPSVFFSGSVRFTSDTPPGGAAPKTNSFGRLLGEGQRTRSQLLLEQFGVPQESKR